MIRKIFLSLILTTTTILSGCTTFDVIMTGEARKPTSADKLKIYLREPENFFSIGLIDVSSNSTPSRSANKKRALKKLKTEAAKLGTNGVLLRVSNGSPNQGGAILIPNGSNIGIVTTGRGSVVEIQGEAIFVLVDKKED